MENCAELKQKVIVDTIMYRRVKISYELRGLTIPEKQEYDRLLRQRSQLATPKLLNIAIKAQYAIDNKIDNDWTEDEIETVKEQESAIEESIAISDAYILEKALTPNIAHGGYVHIYNNEGNEVELSIKEIMAVLLPADYADLVSKAQSLTIITDVEAVKSQSPANPKNEENSVIRAAATKDAK